MSGGLLEKLVDCKSGVEITGSHVPIRVQLAIGIGLTRSNTGIGLEKNKKTSRLK